MRAIALAIGTEAEHIGITMRTEKSTVQVAPPSPLQVLVHAVAALGGHVLNVNDEVHVSAPAEHEEAMNAAVEAYERACVK